MDETHKRVKNARKILDELEKKLKKQQLRVKKLERIVSGRI